MTFYLLRYRVYDAIGQEEVRLLARRLEKEILSEAVTMMRSEKHSVISIHELYYGINVTRTSEMQIAIKDGRFKLEFVPQEDKNENR